MQSRFAHILALSILTSLFVLSACESEPAFANTCEVADPASQLDWLQDLIANHDALSANGASYHAFTYEKKTYIAKGYCGRTLLQWVPTYYDCQGNEPNFSNEQLIEMRKIWTQEGVLLWKGPECE